MLDDILSIARIWWEMHIGKYTEEASAVAPIKAKTDNLPTGVVRPRREVILFATAMEKKLQQNDHKGGWGVSSYPYLVGSLHQELIELERAWSDLRFHEGDDEKRKALLMECADVANFAMMIADNAGLLKGETRLMMIGHMESFEVSYGVGTYEDTLGMVEDGYGDRVKHKR